MAQSETNSSGDAGRRWTADRVALAMLAALVLVGIAVRVAAALAWWPIATNLADSWPYVTHALSRPFDDPSIPLATHSHWRRSGSSPATSAWSASSRT